MATKNIQSITIRVRGVTLMELYISPQTKEVDELQFLERIKTMSGGRSVIIVDMNARHKMWDTRSNCRGRRIREWAKTHHWDINAPSRPTFAFKDEGTSTPDIALTKGARVHQLSS